MEIELFGEYFGVDFGRVVVPGFYRLSRIDILLWSTSKALDIQVFTAGTSSCNSSDC